MALGSPPPGGQDSGNGPTSLLPPLLQPRAARFFKCVRIPACTNRFRGQGWGFCALPGIGFYETWRGRFGGWAGSPSTAKRPRHQAGTTGGITLIPIGKLVRVSTQSADQADSPENQIAFIEQELARERDWLDTGRVYAAELTGAIVVNRPEIQQLLDDCRAGLVQKVVMKSIQRLGRDVLGLIQLKRMLDDLNVELIALQDGYRSFRDPELLYLIFAERAQAGRQDIGKNVSAAQRAIARQGGWAHPGKPYWLQRKGRRQMEPHPIMWAIAREIWDRYLAGEGTREIAADLNRRGIPTPARQNAAELAGKLQERAQEDPRHEKRLARVKQRLAKPARWSMERIRDLIRHHSCKGFLHYGTSVQRRTAAGKRVRVHLPESEWIPVPCPALVSEEEWLRGQQILADRTRLPRRSIRSRWLLSGLLRCACGSTITGSGSIRTLRDGTERTYQYYLCKAQHHSGVCPYYDKPMRAEDVHAAVLDALRAALAQAQAPADEVAPRRDLQRAEARRKELEAALEDLKAARFYRREEHRHGRMTAAELTDELGILAKQEAALRSELAELGKAIQTPGQAQAERRRREELYQRVLRAEAGEMTPEQTQALLREAIRRIVVRHWPDDVEMELLIPDPNAALGAG